MPRESTDIEVEEQRGSSWTVRDIGVSPYTTTLGAGESHWHRAESASEASILF